MVIFVTVDRKRGKAALSLESNPRETKEIKRGEEVRVKSLPIGAQSTVQFCFSVLNGEMANRKRRRDVL